GVGAGAGDRARAGRAHGGRPQRGELLGAHDVRPGAPGARRGLIALGAAPLIAAGCGGGSKTRTVQTTTTKVEVVRQAGAATAGFAARSIYERDAPGVVTVISTGLQSADGDESGLGSGFVISGDGEIATNAHALTSGEGPAIPKASNSYRP